MKPFFCQHQMGGIFCGLFVHSLVSFLVCTMFSCFFKSTKLFGTLVKVDINIEISTKRLGICNLLVVVFNSLSLKFSGHNAKKNIYKNSLIRRAKQGNMRNQCKWCAHETSILKSWIFYRVNTINCGNRRNFKGKLLIKFRHRRGNVFL